jgi:ABC-type uncharacterized transport system permease subunit
MAFSYKGVSMFALVDIGIGLLIVGIASLVLGIGVKLIKENSKRDGQ